MDNDDESASEEMVRELGLDPALGKRIGDDPLLRQARRNTESTSRRSRELRDVDDEDDKPPT